MASSTLQAPRQGRSRFSKALPALPPEAYHELRQAASHSAPPVPPPPANVTRSESRSTPHIAQFKSATASISTVASQARAASQAQPKAPPAMIARRPVGRTAPEPAPASVPVASKAPPRTYVREPEPQPEPEPERNTTKLKRNSSISSLLSAYSRSSADSFQRSSYGSTLTRDTAPSTSPERDSRYSSKAGPSVSDRSHGASLHSNKDMTAAEARGQFLPPLKKVSMFSGMGTLDSPWEDVTVESPADSMNQTSPLRQELWRRRASSKSDHAKVMSDLELSRSNGFTSLASNNKEAHDKTAAAAPAQSASQARCRTSIESNLSHDAFIDDLIYAASLPTSRTHTRNQSTVSSREVSNATNRWSNVHHAHPRTLQALLEKTAADQEADAPEKKNSVRREVKRKPIPSNQSATLCPPTNAALGPLEAAPTQANRGWIGSPPPVQTSAIPLGTAIEPTPSPGGNSESPLSPVGGTFIRQQPLEERPFAAATRSKTSNSHSRDNSESSRSEVHRVRAWSSLKGMHRRGQSSGSAHDSSAPAGEQAPENSSKALRGGPAEANAAHAGRTEVGALKDQPTDAPFPARTDSRATRQPTQTAESNGSGEWPTAQPSMVSRDGSQRRNDAPVTRRPVGSSQSAVRPAASQPALRAASQSSTTRGESRHRAMPSANSITSMDSFKPSSAAVSPPSQPASALESPVLSPLASPVYVPEEQMRRGEASHPTSGYEDYDSAFNRPKEIRRLKSQPMSKSRRAQEVAPLDDIGEVRESMIMLGIEAPADAGRDDRVEAAIEPPSEPRAYNVEPSETGVWPAQPLKRSQYNCFSQHRRMVAFKNVHNRLSCQTCGTEEPALRRMCSHCGVRVCYRCSDLLVKEKRDLSALMATLEKERQQARLQAASEGGMF